MDDAWWGPAIPLPGQPYFCLAERTLPGGLLINASGARFVNEAAPYSDVVHTMYDVNDTDHAIPAWLIVDQNYRSRYLFKDVLPTLPCSDVWYDSGAAQKAWTLDALATSIDVPATALRTTVVRFNSQALRGVGPDFHRGDSAYDHYYTDPSVLPNSCLAPSGSPLTTPSESSPATWAPRGACGRTPGRGSCGRTARRSRACTPRVTRPPR